MTNDQLTSLAKQAGFDEDDGIWLDYPLEIQRFAELVRNQTLEEAAEACERLPLKSAKACAEVIRLEKS